jgi:hypothetical protein
MRLGTLVGIVVSHSGLILISSGICNRSVRIFSIAHQSYLWKKIVVEVD